MSAFSSEPSSKMPVLPFFDAIEPLITARVFDDVDAAADAAPDAAKAEAKALKKAQKLAEKEARKAEKAIRKAQPKRLKSDKPVKPKPKAVQAA